MISCKFTNDNAVFQNFTFPKPVINAILDNSNSEMLKKLYKTCKYFYSVKHVDIIDEFFVSNYGHCSIQEYKLCISSKNISHLKNVLWITQDLHLFYDPSNVIPKILKCDVKKLSLGKNLGLNEFKFLTESGNVEDLYLDHCVIYDSESNPVPVEDIFPLIPKATHLWISPLISTRHTMEILLKFKRKTKFMELALSEIENFIDPHLFNKFLLKNLDDQSFVGISFKNKDMGRAFADQLCEMIKLWTSKECKPALLAIERYRIRRRYEINLI